MLTVDMVGEKVKLGQTSRYLNDIYKKMKESPESILRSRIFIKDSLFMIPPRENQVPIIMVGPGTGLAPFIGFLQEREVTREESDYGEAHLFFGCRRDDHDFIYREDILRYETQGHLTKLHLALSR